MKDRILDSLLHEISEADREIIELFFETYSQRMLRNSDLERVKTGQKSASEASEFQQDYGDKNAGLNSSNLQFLTPTSELSDIPDLRDMDWGAPAPIILASEHRLSLAYYLSNDADWDGEKSQPRHPKLDEDDMAVFYIQGVSSFSQRSTLQPNHLCPYFIYSDDDYPSHGVWEVSSKFRTDFQEKLLAYENDKHLIFSFHDTAVECFCSSYKFEIGNSVSVDLVPKMTEFVYS